MHKTSTIFFLLFSSLVVPIVSSAANKNLPVCEGSPVESSEAVTKIADWDNCIGGIFQSSVRDESGKLWKGLTLTSTSEYREGKSYGKVTTYFSNKDKAIYESQSNASKGIGYVAYYFSDGTYYKGKYLNYTRNGEGIYQYKNSYYVGNFLDGKRHGEGIEFFPSGRQNEGLFKADKFVSPLKTKYNQKSPYKIKSAKPSLLKTEFNKLSITNRKKAQSNLRNLEYYEAKIDGLYGKRTAEALAKFNSKNLSGSDLKVLDNVKLLLNSILDFQVASEKSEPPKTNNEENPLFNVASGSGFYVSVKGHIITNQHVIDGCEEVKVHQNGDAVLAKRIAEDFKNDLALLKASKTPEYVFGFTQDNPYPLQDITVAGFPFGQAVSSTLKFTQGIISSVAGLSNDYSQIQIDAALQPGNSGGPILDEYGNIVGIAVAKLDQIKTLEDYGVIPENTNFGIKSSVARSMMEGNNIVPIEPSSEVISKRELSKKATAGTVYLSCWMTEGQVKKLKSEKVLFTGVN